MMRRILAFLIDHIIGTLIFGIIFWGVNWSSFVNPTDSNLLRPFETFNKILALGMIYYLLKDIIGSRSIGKRVFGITVKNLDNLNAPGPFRLIIRNLTIIVWPIELILVIFGQRRIGDRIARTEVKQLL